MKPYFENDICVLYNADCIEALGCIEGVDSVITSPPYNLNTRVDSKRRYISRQVIKDEFSTKYAGYNDNLHPDEYFSFSDKVISLCLSKSNMIFWNIQLATGNKPALNRLIGKYYDKIKEVVIWDKGHGQPAMNDRTLNSCYEFIYIFENDDPAVRQFANATFERGAMPNIWRIKPERSINKNHGAIFPSQLVDNCLQVSGAKSVLDPFAGTGTTLVRCAERGIKAIGIEVSEEYCECIAKRLEKIQPELF